MSDLIDRQMAIDALGERPDTWTDSEYELGKQNQYDDDLQSILNLKKVDAVEVVRCKDCWHRDPEDKKCDCGHDIIWQLPRDDNWFCADGERKENRCHA